MNNMIHNLFRLAFILYIFSTASINCYDENGYILYCPCMGRFGNQVDHFLGSLAFSKAINRTLVLPPWVEYRYGEPKSRQVAFDTYFKVDSLTSYHRVETMESFMTNIAPKIWPPEKRISFCYTQRIGEEQNSCNAKSGNPFGPFWNTFDVEFVGSEFYGPLNYDAQNFDMILQWRKKYLSDIWPVIAFTGAPASFPVQKENVHLHKYLVWNPEIINKTLNFIKQKMSGGGFLGLHLRNGQDWSKACQHVENSQKLFSTPQCLGYKNEKGKLTLSMCFPQKSEIIKQVKRVLKKLNGLKYIFVASDFDHMVQPLNEAVKKMGVSVITLEQNNPHLDLAILGQANYFIGNCVSSYSAFVKRERDVRGLPSEFWSFPNGKKRKYDEL
ncbi:GDP-fucose protein O-fucosyltransferase 1 [Aricia agestis]|uniref:GDP-fucose protein O-fucosyltransferase 1 n=1 Tax=Aricia agestis TaxID=91739 RepID=UPI001C20586C|nr:GDP-fucose protein O-fucosyltransferase 1 [Aricia agestis]